MIWNNNVNDILNGYVCTQSHYQCVICDKAFEKGKIYKINDSLYDAYGSIKQHIHSEHVSVASYLLSQEANLIGISDIQSQILSLLLEGKSDKEIGNKLEIAQSTVRNHRFKLREKEKQAKLFVALMGSLKEQTSKPIEISDSGILEEVRKTATMVDDRYNITDVERKKTVDTYMDSKSNTLKSFPAREKKKIIILGEIAKHFTEGVEYSETEINKTLKQIYEADYPTIRRALIEYGFMVRTTDCKKYRVKE